MLPISLKGLLFLYLDRGTFSAQFPLDWLCPCRLLPFSETEVVLPHEEGKVGLKVYPHSQEGLGKSSEEEYHFSDHVLPLIPFLDLLPYQEQGTQTEEQSGYHPALQQLQDFNQARI